MHVAAALLAVSSIIPWAWERREDLRFLGEHHTVAYYAGLITLDHDRVTINPRRNPLLLAAKTHRVAVVRIETKQPTLDAKQRRATLEAIRNLYSNAEELQIDFDATTTERAFYRALLFDIRRNIDARLTITALASWCIGDRWIRDLPIDDAIPMLFRMGGDARAIRARLARGEDFVEPRCRASIGVALDEPLPVPRARRVWVFHSKPWTEAAWKDAEQFAPRY
ncbi:MAG TPA: hypothetical protein VKB93_09800 [Thermoanaerobaculia bacterium]|nr:hypothetical protein [Thermoanaerobaculia bacterium]